ncbi:MAG: PadR family transcriptional regulator [Solirubrobacteraceae bacterium]
MVARETRKVARLDGTSLTRAAVLSALVEQPAYGWDVARRAKRRVGSLARIDHKYVYTILDWLVREKFVRAQQERFERHPYVRDVYYVTEKGINAREAWMAAPLTTRVAMSDLEARLLFSTQADIPVVLRAIGECQDVIAEEIEQNTFSTTVDVSFLGTLINLQRTAVDKRLKAEREWLVEVRRELEDLRDHPPPR